MSELEGITIKDYSEEVLNELEDAVKVALKVCGETAETYAKKACPVDTGLLKNSITYALAGEKPAVSSYKANKGDGHGSYSGTAPSDGSGSYSVCLGTNVEYAETVELGKGQTKQPYISPAIKDHADKYRQIIKKYLGGG